MFDYTQLGRKFIHADDDKGFHWERYEIIPINEAECYIDDDSENLYSTWFNYSKEAVYYYNQNKKLGGYDGVVDVSMFPIDIDVDNAQEVAQQILSKLIHEFDVDERNIMAYFSGCKGFHIYISSKLFGISPTLMSELVKRFKWIAKELHDDIDFNLYKKNMLLRVENTIHSKSGIRKIPLTVKELMQYDLHDIRQLAKYPRYIDYPYFHEGVINDTLEAMWTLSKEKEIKSPTPPKNTVSTITNIPNGVSEGNRNNTCMDISLNYAHNGYTYDDIEQVILEWNQTNNPPESNTEELKATIRNALGYVCNAKKLCYQCKQIFRIDSFYNSLPTNDYKVIYIYILMNLNDKDKLWNGVQCRKNQFITTYNTLARECNTTKNKARGLINYLLKQNKIKKDVVEVEFSKGSKNSLLITWLE